MNWYRKRSLSTKFTIILALVFVASIAIGGFVLYQGAQRRAQAEVANRAEAMLGTMNAVRTYTGNHVRPLLVDQLNTTETFIPETVPGYSARTVFMEFRTNPEFKSFVYKEATLNPTNPIDKADDFEADLVTQFRADDGLDELTGFRSWNGENMFYIARPMRINAESCLECHSDPASAPPSLITTYGDQGGFGWEMNEIVAAQVIYVPADDVLGQGRSLFGLVVGVFGALFAGTILLINRLLKPTVVAPVQRMATLAQQITNDEMDDEVFAPDYLRDVSERGDELGELAKVLQQMAQEVRNREQRLKTELQQLRIEIDQARRQRDVKQISETEYFQELQARANDLRNRNYGNKPSENPI